VYEDRHAGLSESSDRAAADPLADDRIEAIVAECL
jgi:hypothetical protein